MPSRLRIVLVAIGLSMSGCHVGHENAGSIASEKQSGKPPIAQPLAADAPPPGSEAAEAAGTPAPATNAH